MPVVLVANGNENGLGCSINFSPSILSFAGATVGGGASGASLLINTNQIGLGRLGLAVAFPAGVTFTPGTQEVAQVTFTTAILTHPSSTFLTFGDQPVQRELSDSAGNTLVANYAIGTIGIVAAVLGGDVSPRPDGNSAVSISDWVLVGRYAARLAYPTNGSEFQRADCAPRETLGDGAITVIDWVQAGRYAAGLDPMTVAGGPTNESVGSIPGASTSVMHKLGGSSRELLVTSGLLFSGQTTAAGVDLVAQGNENALGFSLGFDPTLLSFSGASLGANAAGATVNINTNQTASGRLGVVLALSTGASFPIGTQEVLKLSFQAISINTVTSQVSFSDLPVPRQVSDPSATALTASYLDAAVNINPLPLLNISKAGQNITLAWPLWATNFVLQTSDSLGHSAVWSNAPAFVTVTNGAGVVNVPISGQARFYRLYHP